MPSFNQDSSVREDAPTEVKDGDELKYDKDECKDKRRKKDLGLRVDKLKTPIFCHEVCAFL